LELLVDDSVSLADSADRLREIGIFLEKVEMIGIIMPTAAAEPTTAEQPMKQS
jgi:hypothetical protein